MTASLPRLRADLTVSRQLTADGEVFIVKDPVRREFYRFREAEHFIVHQLDGATSLDTVCQRVEQEFGAPLAPEMLKAFVSRLEKAKLLETGKSPAKSSKRVAGSVLYLRFKLFDPDRLFNFLITRILFFFTPTFLLLSGLSIITGVAIAMSGWQEALQDLSRLYRFSAIPVILLVAFLVVGAHEFAHGLTCKYFGGEVREIGFFLVYFQPALYCNVSDAWLFPEKSKRLWVGFAGPYFELFIWSLATMAWRLTEVETTINLVAFIIMTTSGVKTLFNFNPLIKLDGYYLLSDWLEMPNLRKRAFASIGQRIKSLFGGHDEEAPQIPARERRICLVYGLIASIASFALIGFAVTKLRTYLVNQAQPLALAPLAGLLAVKVRRRFRGLFGKSSGNPEDGDEEDEPADKEQAPRRAKHKKTKSSLPSRKHILMALAAGAAIFLIFGHTHLKIGGPLNILPIHNSDVRAEVEGIVEKVMVGEGDTVQEGGLIARLVDREWQSELRKNRADIEEATARLKLFQAGARAEEILLSKTLVASAKERITFASNRVERDKLLFEQKLLSQKDFEDSQAYLADRQNELSEATGKLKVLLAGRAPEEMEAIQAEIARLNAKRLYLEEQLQLLDVLSPASGIIATPSRQLTEMRHQLVKKGDLIAKVFDLKTITAEIAIAEQDIADIKLGQKVMLKARAYPEMTFIGKVTSIATAAQISAASASAASAAAQSVPGAALTRNSLAAKTILVTTEIDNQSLLLKPEMTGQAKIFCGDRRLLQLMTRRLARTLKVQFWSWW